MNVPILVGTRGWDHPVWRGGFYPEELPADWRLTYYNNLLRAVLVPGDSWTGIAEPDVRQWAEDSDPAFRFVLELPDEVARPGPPRAPMASLTEFFRSVAPIHAQTAGLLVRVAPGASLDVSWLEALLAGIGTAHRVCVDLPSAWRVDAALEALARHGCGLCWRADSEPDPVPGGRLLIALSSEGTARGQRVIVEKLAAGCRDGAIGGLFFEGERAAESASQARLIAELMGV